MSTILLVEDTPIIREPLARLLQAEGYEVLAAGDGLQANELLKQRRANLILLDVMMPHMDGVAFLESVRGNPMCAELPVIVVTAVLDSQRLNRLRELGVKSIITKGRFAFDNLMAEVRTHLPVPPLAA